MPIEIRELIIRTTVNPSDGGGNVGSGVSGDEEKQQLIQECVDQVIDILKEKWER